MSRLELAGRLVRTWPGRRCRVRQSALQLSVGIFGTDGHEVVEELELWAKGAAHVDTPAPHGAAKIRMVEAALAKLEATTPAQAPAPEMVKPRRLPQGHDPMTPEILATMRDMQRRREALHLERKQIAILLGVAKSTVQELERCRLVWVSPRLKQYLALLDRLERDGVPEDARAAPKAPPSQWNAWPATASI